MRSSLQSSFSPSAGDWSQPKRPPVRVGPSRSWIRAETFRSIQLKTATETSTTANSSATCTSRGQRIGQPRQRRAQVQDC